MRSLFFSLWCLLWQTIKIAANFLCNSLLHGKKTPYIWDRFSSFFLKIVQNEKDYSFTLTFCNFSKIFGRCEMGAPHWCHFPKFFKAVLHSQITIESSKLRTMYFFFRWKIWSSVIFSSSGNLTILLAKGAKFLYSIQTVMKRWNSITMVFLRLIIEIIEFWDIFLKNWNIMVHSESLILTSFLNMGQKRSKFLYLV